MPADICDKFQNSKNDNLQVLGFRGISVDAMKDQIIAKHKHNSLKKTINVEKINPMTLSGVNILTQKQMYLRKQQKKSTIYLDTQGGQNSELLVNLNTENWTQNADLSQLEKKNLQT